MDIGELIDTASALVSLAAVLAVVLLLPLYVSQRRDLKRLRDWMEREPEHPGADLVASETLLDRAEAELEELLGVAPETAAATEVKPPAGATPAGPLPAATRVTSERPALERITIERAALEPHPRWRRFASRATQPRVLVAVGVVALLAGLAAIFGSELLLRDGGGDGSPRAAAIDKAEVQVTVLNGTSVTGLAGLVADDVQSSGYRLGDVTNTEPGFERTLVMYAAGQQRAARKVARDLGVKEVQPIDGRTRALAGDADVVVIAGEDRARP